MIATVTFVIVTLFLIAVSFSISLKGFKRKDEAHEYDKYYVMITDNYKSDFWKSVYRGAFAAAKEDNIYVDLLGENFSTKYKTEELMKIATASKVDGIILYANESDEMTQLIDAAAAEGIPVVTLYGDNTRSKRLSYVGIGGYAIGREYAKQINNIIREKKIDNTEESEKNEQDKTMQVTVLVNSDAGNSGENIQNIIIAAMQEGIAQEEADGIDVSISIKTVDNTNDFSAEESIRDIFHTEQVPDVIVCLNELNTTCAYQAVVDFNEVGKVNILGCYASESIINAIDIGVVYATIAIDTNQLGEQCIKALSDYYESGNTSEYYAADVSLINKSNVAEYMKKEEEQNE
ncbi:substrate-binding domain-containing protein [Butyrivibrio sp. AE3003]|uniref:substrate-binding domain-containing protein n=1 Tax=Butyrivibrio sp. AE3003 TaxID=1496721 RepID=UPI00047AFC21|nr:substrate-binding domain-containing protein [Butyrivibrio sp. AE3003]